jgi:hypothetical protein
MQNQGKAMPRKRTPAVFPASMRATRVKVPKNPVKLLLQEYADRLLSLSADEAIPPTLGLRLENYVFKKDEECPPVIVAMRKIAQLRQSTWRQWLDEFICVTIYTRKWRKLEMYWCVNRYFFVETNLLNEYVRASLVYNTRDLAMSAYRLDMISWIHTQSIDKPLDKVPCVS